MHFHTSLHDILGSSCSVNKFANTHTVCALCCLCQNDYGREGAKFYARYANKVVNLFLFVI